MLHLKFLTTSFLAASIALFSYECNESQSTFSPFEAEVDFDEFAEADSIYGSWSDEEACCESTRNSRIQIGANYSYAWVTPRGDSTTKGSLYGAQGIYEYRPIKSLYAAIALDFRQGYTRLDGFRRYLLDVNAQERFGYTFSTELGGYRLAFFTGLGGRYMYEKLTLGPDSIALNYVQFYGPTGFLSDWEIGSNWNWGLGFQWRPQIFPNMQVQPTRLHYMLKYHINNYYAEMPITFKLQDRSFSLILKPYFELWHDGRVLLKGTDIPGNRYYFGGFDANVVWQF